MSERPAGLHGEHVKHSSFESNQSGADLLGREYAHGEIIFREGDLENALYIVQSGMVRIVTTLSNGREVEIAAVGPGEAFGIAALADDKIMPRYATATADGRTSILMVDRTRLIKAIYDDATLIFSIFKAMSRRARNLTERLVTCESNHGEDPPE